MRGSDHLTIRVAIPATAEAFGKGVVQSIYPMPDQGALKITTARYVTPLGRDIQHRGITPDILVDQAIDPTILGTKKDKQLMAAEKHLGQSHETH